MTREELEQLRKASGLSVTRLANRLGISRTQAWRIISGDSRFSNPLQMLAFRLLVEGDHGLRERSETLIHHKVREDPL